MTVTDWASGNDGFYRNTLTINPYYEYVHGIEDENFPLTKPGQTIKSDYQYYTQRNGFVSSITYSSNLNVTHTAFNCNRSGGAITLSIDGFTYEPTGTQITSFTFTLPTTLQGIVADTTTLAWKTASATPIQINETVHFTGYNRSKTKMFTGDGSSVANSEDLYSISAGTATSNTFILSLYDSEITANTTYILLVAFDAVAEEEEGLSNSIGGYYPIVFEKRGSGGGGDITSELMRIYAVDSSGNEISTSSKRNLYKYNWSKISSSFSDNEYDWEIVDSILVKGDYVASGNTFQHLIARNNYNLVYDSSKNIDSSYISYISGVLPLDEPILAASLNSENENNSTNSIFSIAPVTPRNYGETVYAKFVSDGYLYNAPQLNVNSSGHIDASIRIDCTIEGHTPSDGSEYRTYINYRIFNVFAFAVQSSDGRAVYGEDSRYRRGGGSNYDHYTTKLQHTFIPQYSNVTSSEFIEISTPFYLYYLNEIYDLQTKFSTSSAFQDALSLDPSSNLIACDAGDDAINNNISNLLQFSDSTLTLDTNNGCLFYANYRIPITNIDTIRNTLTFDDSSSGNGFYRIIIARGNTSYFKFVFNNDFGYPDLITSSDAVSSDIIGKKIALSTTLPDFRSGNNGSDLTDEFATDFYSFYIGANPLNNTYEYTYASNYSAGIDLNFNDWTDKNFEYAKIKLVSTTSSGSGNLYIKFKGGPSQSSSDIITWYDNTSISGNEIFLSNDNMRVSSAYQPKIYCTANPSDSYFIQVQITYHLGDYGESLDIGGASDVDSSTVGENITIRINHLTETRLEFDDSTPNTLYFVKNSKEKIVLRYYNGETDNNTTYPTTLSVYCGCGNADTADLIDVIGSGNITATRVGSIMQNQSTNEYYYKYEFIATRNTENLTELSDYLNVRLSSNNAIKTNDKTIYFYDFYLNAVSSVTDNWNNYYNNGKFINITGTNIATAAQTNNDYPGIIIYVLDPVAVSTTNDRILCQSGAHWAYSTNTNLRLQCTSNAVAGTGLSTADIDATITVDASLDASIYNNFSSYAKNLSNYASGVNPFNTSTSFTVTVTPSESSNTTYSNYALFANPSSLSFNTGGGTGTVILSGTRTQTDTTTVNGYSSSTSTEGVTWDLKTPEGQEVGINYYTLDGNWISIESTEHNTSYNINVSANTGSNRTGEISYTLSEDNNTVSVSVEITQGGGTLNFQRDQGISNNSDDVSYDANSYTAWIDTSTSSELNWTITSPNNCDSSPNTGTGSLTTDLSFPTNIPSYYGSTNSTSYIFTVTDNNNSSNTASFTVNQAGASWNPTFGIFERNTNNSIDGSIIDVDYSKQDYSFDVKADFIWEISKSNNTNWITMPSSSTDGIDNTNTAFGSTTNTVDTSTCTIQIGNNSSDSNRTVTITISYHDNACSAAGTKSFTIRQSSSNESITVDTNNLSWEYNEFGSTAGKTVVLTGSNLNGTIGISQDIASNGNMFHIEPSTTTNISSSSNTITYTIYPIAGNTDGSINKTLTLSGTYSNNNPFSESITLTHKAWQREFSISPTTATVGSNGGPVEFTVTANDSFTVTQTTSKARVTISPDSDSIGQKSALASDYTISIGIPGTAETSEVTYTFEVNCGGTTKTFTVTQSASSGNLSITPQGRNIWAFNENDSRIFVLAYGGSGNIDWQIDNTVTNYNKWNIADPSGNTSGTLSATGTNSINISISPKDYNITAPSANITTPLNITTNIPDVKCNSSLTHTGWVPTYRTGVKIGSETNYDYVNMSKNISMNGETIRFEITTNFNWEAVVGGTNSNIAEISGDYSFTTADYITSEIKIFTITVHANSNNDPKSFTVTIHPTEQYRGTDRVYTFTQGAGNYSIAVSPSVSVGAITGRTGTINITRNAPEGVSTKWKITSISNPDMIDENASVIVLENSGTDSSISVQCTQWTNTNNSRHCDITFTLVNANGTSINDDSYSAVCRVTQSRADIYLNIQTSSSGITSGTNKTIHERVSKDASSYTFYIYVAPGNDSNYNNAIYKNITSDSIGGTLSLSLENSSQPYYFKGVYTYSENVQTDSRSVTITFNPGISHSADTATFELTQEGALYIAEFTANNLKLSESRDWKTKYHFETDKNIVAPYMKEYNGSINVVNILQYDTITVKKIKLINNANNVIVESSVNERIEKNSNKTISFPITIPKLPDSLETANPKDELKFSTEVVCCSGSRSSDEVTNNATNSDVYQYSYNNSFPGNQIDDYYAPDKYSPIGRKAIQSTSQKVSYHGVGSYKCLGAQDSQTVFNTDTGISERTPENLNNNKFTHNGSYLVFTPIYIVPEN